MLMTGLAEPRGVQTNTTNLKSSIPAVTNRAPP